MDGSNNNRVVVTQSFDIPSNIRPNDLDRFPLFATIQSSIYGLISRLDGSVLFSRVDGSPLLTRL